MQSLGRHIIVEYYNCDPELLNDVVYVEKSMREAAIEAYATIVSSTFHHFSPYGVSGVVVIQESHLAIHTWPEYKFASVDIFTCGLSVDPWLSLGFLEKAFKAGHYSAMELRRGQKELLKDMVTSAPIHTGQQARPENLPKGGREIWFTERTEDLALSIRHSGEMLYRCTSPYQRIEVFNTETFGKTLVLNGVIATTESDEFAYHEMITHVPAFAHGNPKQVLVMGGGDGGIVKEILKHPTVEKVTVVELDEEVVKVAKEFFPDISQKLSAPEVELHIENANIFIKTLPKESYDLVIIDSTDPLWLEQNLKHSIFMEINRVLKPDGIMTTQMGSPDLHRELFKKLFKELYHVFKKEQVWCYLVSIPTYPAGTWGFAFAGKGEVNPVKNINNEGIMNNSDFPRYNYYNTAIHKAAFVLPNYISRLIEKDTNTHY